MPRTDIGGNEIPDPGERCEACQRPLLWTGELAIPVRTRVVVREEIGEFAGKKVVVQVGREGTARVCPDCAPLLKAAG